MTRKWTEDELTAIVKRSGARLVNRDLKAEPHKVRENLPMAQTEKDKEYHESEGERLLIQQMRLAGIADWRREYRFLPDRRYRLDFAWVAVKLAVEVEGGTFSGGRHVRGKGFAADCEKYNLLALAGWRLLRFTTEQVKRGEAIQPITDMLVGTGENHAQVSDQ